MRPSGGGVLIGTMGWLECNKTLNVSSVSNLSLFVLFYFFRAIFVSYFATVYYSRFKFE